MNIHTVQLPYTVPNLIYMSLDGEEGKSVHFVKFDADDENWLLKLCRDTWECSFQHRANLVFIRLRYNGMLLH